MLIEIVKLQGKIYLHIADITWNLYTSIWPNCLFVYLESVFLLANIIIFLNIQGVVQ